MSKVEDGAKPDLEFYYDVKQTKSTVTFSNEDLETRISQNTVFLDKELTIPIGNYVYDFMNNKDKGVYVSTFSFTFENYTNLSGGFQASMIRKNNIVPGFVNPNSYTVDNIYTGNGSFLGATGFMVILSDSTPIRRVLVYFSK